VRVPGRSLKRRASGSAWREAVARAASRGVQVFADNLAGALLAPSLRSLHAPLQGFGSAEGSSGSAGESTAGSAGGGSGIGAGGYGSGKAVGAVLAVDPGHAHGCKCALLKPDGNLLPDPALGGYRCTSTSSTSTSTRDLSSSALFTVYPHRNRTAAVADLRAALLRAAAYAEATGSSGGRGGCGVFVGLGDGHGSSEAMGVVRDAIQLAASQAGASNRAAMAAIPIAVVRENGASVWSASGGAAAEFPGVPPAALGAVSLGRRLLDPLSELVQGYCSRIFAVIAFALCVSGDGAATRGSCVD